MKSLLAILFPLLLVLFIYNPAASGYTLLGSDWSYQPDPMGESIAISQNTSDTSGTLNAILNAMDTWDNAGAHFKFTYGGSADNPAPKYDGVNQIRWIVPGDTDSWLAITTWWSSGGKILEADVAFNDKYTWATGDTIPTGSFDVQSVALHELGHVVGLGHSSAPAIMQPSISSGLKRRILTSDDINGILAIYGSANNNNTNCIDADGDGYFSTEGCGTLVDCNDNDKTIHPGAAELCDGKDNNCDGRVDEGCCTDNDGDGYYAQPNCGTPVDCDDLDPDVNPGAPELCDGIDNNCNGDIDEGCTLPDLTAKWLEVKKTRNYVRGKLSVNNIGNEDVMDRFYVKLYLSEDEVWDEGDVLLRSYRLNWLKVGYSRALSFVNRVRGQGYLIAVVDPTQVIEESNEDNNVTIFPLQ